MTTFHDGDETTDRVEDNSVGRVFALSDGIFAIAMTLLALDLKVPDVQSPVTDAHLRQALAHNTASYWSFLVSFAVVASYWGRHRRLMRSVTSVNAAILRDTIVLLLIVAAMPFPASLLSRYGSQPTAVALYCVFNSAATLVLMRMRHDISTYELDNNRDYPREDQAALWMLRINLGIFLACIPLAYAVGHHGLWLFVLLGWPRIVAIVSDLRKRRGREAPSTAGSSTISGGDG